MTNTDNDRRKHHLKARLVLLNSEPRDNPGPSLNISVRQARLRVIDCRASLVETLRENEAHRPLREVTERLVGRFAAMVAAKLRR